MVVGFGLLVLAFAEQLGASGFVGLGELAAVGVVRRIELVGPFVGRDGPVEFVVGAVAVAQHVERLGDVLAELVFAVGDEHLGGVEFEEGLVFHAAGDPPLGVLEFGACQPALVVVRQRVDGHRLLEVADRVASLAVFQGLVAHVAVDAGDGVLVGGVLRQDVGCPLQLDQGLGIVAGLLERLTQQRMRHADVGRGLRQIAEPLEQRVELVVGVGGDQGVPVARDGPAGQCFAHQCVAEQRVGLDVVRASIGHVAQQADALEPPIGLTDHALSLDEDLVVRLSEHSDGGQIAGEPIAGRRHHGGAREVLLGIVVVVVGQVGPSHDVGGGGVGSVLVEQFLGNPAGLVGVARIESFNGSVECRRPFLGLASAARLDGKRGCRLIHRNAKALKGDGRERRGRTAAQGTVAVGLIGT